MIETNVPLKEFTTIKVGGIAKYFARPKDKKDLVEYLKIANDKGINVYILGKGANTIFGDFDGVVLHTKHLGEIQIKELERGLYVKAQCGVSLANLIKLALSQNLEGIYRLVGFPATVGGAVAMNAGAFGYEIKDNLLSVEFLDWEGNLQVANAKDLEFLYRKSPFPDNGILLSAEFFFYFAQKPIKEEYEKIKEKRVKTQPINMPTSGSTFKNPQGDYAGRLLELVGMKGYTLGDIGFSNLHSNFLVNLGNATFQDVKRIIKEAKRRVYETFGIELQEEVKLVESGCFDGWKVA